MGPAKKSKTVEVVCAGILVADTFNAPADRLPVEGELIQVTQIESFVGGCAANVAVNLAKQGAGVAVMGKVGDDPQGRFVQQALTAHGVEAGSIAVSDVEPTSQTMIILVQGQDRRFLHCFGANRAFGVNDIDREIARRAKVFYLGGYLVMPGLDADAVASLLAELQDCGVKIVLDVVIPAGAEAFEALETVLPHVDVFTPNADEAARITGLTHPAQQARELARYGVSTVVITRGAEGAVVCADGHLFNVAAYPITEVDPSGGGDAFTAGLIAGLARGRPLEESLARANALGASCVSAVGCHAGTFTAKQAKTFVQTHPLTIERID